MERLLLLICTSVFCVILNAQTEYPEYDSTLAKRLGADDYGMKIYVFVILKSGSEKLENKQIRDSIFRGHLRNIGRLADMGKLVIAGPFGNNEKSYRGIFILNVRTFDEAKELLKTDPAIKEKLLEPELYEWYGSAAISEYLKTQKRIVRKQF